MLRSLIVLVFFFAATSAFAQGGPPYYTNDPGTPGNLNWEINLGYMPFYYSGNRSRIRLTSTLISDSAIAFSLLMKMPGCGCRILAARLNLDWGNRILG